MHNPEDATEKRMVWSEDHGYHIIVDERGPIAPTIARTHFLCNQCGEIAPVKYRANSDEVCTRCLPRSNDTEE